MIPPIPASRRAAAMGLFFLSGATGLVYEVLWLKELGLVFGNAGHATATTLTVFFGGLAVGSWVFGRRAARFSNGLRAYGWLEIGVGAAALLYFTLRGTYVLFYAPIYEAFGHSLPLLLAAKLLLTLPILFPAAFLMGGTLPVLGQYLVRSGENLGRAGPLLYAANTIGAAAGALAAGFYLPAVLGFRNTYLLGITLNVVIGVSAIVLSRRDTAVPVVPESPPAMPLKKKPPPRFEGVPEPTRADVRLAAAIALLSGFMTLGFQVMWTRMFALVLPNSVYTFAAILAVFLTSLALGSVLASLLARTRFRPGTVLVTLLAAGGLAVGAIPFVFVWWTDGLRPIGAGAGWSAYVGSMFADVMSVIMLPGILIGAVFPYLLRLVQSPGAMPGRAIGRLTAINTAGAIGGAVVTGFILLSVLGLWGTSRLFAVTYLLLGLCVTLATKTGRAPLARLVTMAGALLLFTVFNPSRLPLTFVDQSADERLVDSWEGTHGVTAVVRSGDDFRISVNNLYTLGGSESPDLDQNQAVLPLMVHAQPRSVFFLGMGTGITAGGALLVPGVEEVVVAELIPEVVTAAESYFDQYTSGLFSDPRVRVRVEDGRNHLLGTRRRYDVIVSDLFTPWEAGTGSLYTREHFEAAFERLQPPGGAFVQWLPLFQLSSQEFAIIARTMLDVFPEVVVWRGDFFPTKPILALVGHVEPQALDPAVFIERGRLMSGRPDLSPEVVTVLTLPFYAGNLSAAADILPPGPLNTDDRPLVEYRAPVTQRNQRAGRTEWFHAQELVDFLARLMERVPPETDPYLAKLSAGERDYVHGGLSYYRAMVLRHLQREDEAQKWFADFSARVPVPFSPGEEQGRVYTDFRDQ